MRPLLEAFLSSDVVATLTKLLHEPADSETYLKNVLLLPPSIHKAFRAGHVDIRPRLDIRDLPYPRDDDSLEHCVVCPYGPFVPRYDHLTLTDSAVWIVYAVARGGNGPIPRRWQSI